MAKSSLIGTVNWRARPHRLFRELVDALDTDAGVGHTHNGTNSASLTPTGNTLDQAYDQGGVGAGRAITVDSGAVALTNNAVNNNGVFTVTKSPAGAQSGDGIVVTMGANATGAALNLANTGTGNDVTGTNWSVSQAGVVTAVAVSHGTNPAAAGAVRLANAAWIAGRNAANNADVNAFRVNASNEIEVNGPARVTGNLTVDSNLTVTGTFNISGNWDVGAQLTVDELVFDTDGVAPAGTVGYMTRVNADSAVYWNVPTAYSHYLRVNGVNEYQFSATILDMNANALDNAGYIIMNAATAPAGTEVYAVNDNTGDLTVNALVTKQFIVAVAGTDEYTFSATAFDLE